jgi:hypothetical protein
MRELARLSDTDAGPTLGKLRDKLLATEKSEIGGGDPRPEWRHAASGTARNGSASIASRPSISNRTPP